jgi:tetratricopeptide (TPR) repeat protein
VPFSYKLQINVYGGKKRDWRAKHALLVGVSTKMLSKHDKAIKINPQLSDVWYNKGYALDILCKLEGAIEAFDKAIESIHNLQCMAQQGNVLVKLNKLGCY